MQYKAHQRFTLQDRSYVSGIKKDVARLAESIGFTEAQRGKIDIILSEMTSNLLKHQTLNPEILVKEISTRNNPGLEIISLDGGPGMKDPVRMMEDGVSTYGSKGEGLGAIKRLSTEFDLYSLYGTGTCILSRIFVNEIPAHKSPEHIKLGAVMVPKRGETVSGDGWIVDTTEDTIRLLVVDGLGHGPEAHLASAEATKALLETAGLQPADALRQIHQAIKRTRGAVGALAEINAKDKALKYCGIGNIGVRIIYKDLHKNMFSYNGILGNNIPTTLSNHSADLSTGDIMIAYSDGIKSRWDYSKYVNISRHDPSVIAAVIYKDNTRTTDDTLVVVLKQQR